MEKKLEQLNAKYARLQTQMEQAQHLQQRMENRRKYLDGGKRKKRTHRLITRGAAVESLVPELKPLNEDAFYDLMAYVFSRQDVKAVVASVVEHYAQGS